MSANRGVLSNTAYQLIHKLITAAGAFFVTVLVTRYLGVSGYGDYTIVFTYITLFYVMLDFGINGVFLRDYGSSQARFAKYFSSLIVLRILISLVFIAISLLLLPLLSFGSSNLAQVRLAIIFGSAMILAQGLHYSLQAGVAYEGRFDKQIWSGLAGSLLNLLLVWYGVSHNWGLVGLVASSTAGSFLAGLVLFYLLERNWYWELTWPQVTSLFKMSAAVGVSLVFNVLLTHADKFLLSFLVSSEQVGLFGLASRVFETTLVLPTFFIIALYPVIILAKKTHIERYKSRLTWGVELSLIMALPVCVFGYIYANPIISLLGGADFSRSAVILQALLIPAVIFYLTALLRAVVVAEGKDRWLPHIYIIGFIFDFVLNLFLIRPYGVIVCAVINGVSEGLILVLLSFVLRKTKLIKVNVHRLAGILFSALIAGLFWWWAREWSWLLSLAIGGALYTGLLFYLKLITRDTLEF